VSAANPFHWLIVLGALLIAVVLFAPRGLAGLVASLARGRAAARRGSP
jgi:branched-chain amino acid transport system permease protein